MILTVLLAVLLVAVCSVREAGTAARTPSEILATARRLGVLRITGAAGLAVVIVVLLIASAIPLSLATQLANLGGMR